MKTAIRVAIPGEEDVLAELNSVVQQFHHAQNPDHFKPFSLRCVTGYFRELLNEQTSRIWLLASGEYHLGYISTVIRSRAENAFCHSGRFLEIDQICIQEGFRGRGLGKSLVRTAVEFAEEKGITNIQLSSWVFNLEAREAFEKMGFVPRIIRFKLNSGVCK